MLPKVCVVSIVKDEAAYIADWVAHHVYFGFDDFHFVVNRTTDATVSIIEGLARVYSGITYEYADWIDICHPKIKGCLQQISYSKAFKNIASDYFMFIDLDEYWTPSDFKESIKSNIIDNDYPSVIYYQWHAELGVLEPFQNFRQKNNYYLMSLGKSLVKKDTAIDMFRVHVPVTSDPVVMSDGTAFRSKAKPPQFVHPSVSAIRKNFIVHRMYRSESEYLAKLLNTNVDTKKSIKHNRKDGFAVDHPDSFNFDIDHESYTQYYHFITNFTASLKSDVEMSENLVLSLNGNFYINIPSLYVKDSVLLKSSLRGISDRKVTSLIEELDSAEISYDSYCQLSEYYQSNNEETLATAYRIGLESFSK